MFGYKQLQNQQNRFGLSIKSPCNASIKSMQIVCDDRRSTQKKRNAEGKPIPPLLLQQLMKESVSTQKWTFTILLHMLDVSNSQFQKLILLSGHLIIKIQCFFGLLCRQQNTWQIWNLLGTVRTDDQRCVILSI